MGIFSAIMDKIFHHAAPAADQAAPADAAPADAAPTADAAPAAAAEPAEPVDVGAVLSQMAEEKGGGGDYEHSIVDLLKLLDLDSSLEARKQLAEELDVHVADDGSAEQNIALHKAVVEELAENGGKIPDSMRH